MVSVAPPNLGLLTRTSSLTYSLPAPPRRPLSTTGAGDLHAPRSFNATAPSSPFPSSDLVCFFSHQLHLKGFYSSRLISRIGVPVVAQRKWTGLVSTRIWVQSLALLSGLRIWCRHEQQCRSQMQLGLVLLRLWCRMAAAAPIWLLAWELPCDVPVAPEREKKVLSPTQVIPERFH